MAGCRKQSQINARVHEGFLEDTAEPAADDTFIQENPDNCVPVPPWRQAAAAEEEEIALMRGPASGSETAAELAHECAALEAALLAEMEQEQESLASG